MRCRAKPLRLIALLTVAVLILSACGGGHQTRFAVTPPTQAPIAATPTPLPTRAPEEAPNIREHQLYSSITGITYPVHVYLPEDYNSTDRTYPIIYTTDGQWVFGGFRNQLYQFGIDAILVAIEQGPNDRRAVDYRLPGAVNYFQVLVTELLPIMESEYRADQSQRTLVGTSYGGLFVGIALLIDDVVAPNFINYLSFDGSFYENPNGWHELLSDRFNANQTLNATLVLTTATEFGNHGSVSDFNRRLDANNFDGLDIIRFDIPVRHNDVAPPSFEQALQALFIR
jgi:Predicted hydrolase of the alpha/beta superfamily